MQRNRYNEEIILGIEGNLPKLLKWYGYSLSQSIVFMRELYQHLIYINISRNNISLIPRDFGTLPTLQKLDISYNKLGWYNDYSWSWLEQTAIKNSLLILDLSGNFVSYNTELKL